MPSAQKIIDIIINVSTKKATAAFSDLKKGASGVGDKVKDIGTKGVDGFSKAAKGAASSTKAWASTVQNNAKALNSAIASGASYRRVLDGLADSSGLNSDATRAQIASIREYNRVLDAGGSTAAARTASLNAATSFASIDDDKARDLLKVTEDVSRTAKDSAKDLLNLSNGLNNLNFGDAKKGLKGIIQLTRVFRSGLAGSIVSFAGFKVGLAAFGAALTGVITAAVRGTQEFREAVQRTRIDANELSALSFELSQTVVGARVQDLQEASLNISERFGEAAKDAGAIRDALLDMGITLDEIVDVSFQGPDRALEVFRGLIKETDNFQQALFRVRELAAEDGARILDFLVNDEDTSQLAKERNELLQIGDRDSNVKEINKVSFAFIEVQKVLSGFNESLAAAFSPAVAAAATAFAGGLARTLKFLKPVGTAVIAISKALASFISSTSEIILAILRLSSVGFSAFGNLIGGIKDVSVAFLESIPIIGRAVKAVNEFFDIDTGKSEEFGTRFNQFANEILVEIQERSVRAVGKEGTIYGQLVAQRKIFVAEQAKLIDSEIASNQELANARKNFLFEINFNKADQQLKALRKLNETGIIPTDPIGESDNDLVARLASRNEALFEANEKIAAEFGRVNDLTKVESVERAIKNQLEQLESLSEKTLQAKTDIANSGLTDDIKKELDSVVDKTLESAQLALQRLETQRAILKSEVAFNRDFARLEAISAFQANARGTARLKLAKDLYLIEKNNIDKLTSDEILAVQARRIAYFNNVEAIEEKTERTLRELRANDFSSIFDIDFSDELNLDNGLTNILQNVNAKIVEINKNALDGISPETANELKARATALGEELKIEAFKQVEKNRAELRKDALTLEEVVGLDFYEADDYKDAINELTEAMETQRATILKARLNDVINDDQASEANKKLIAEEKRKISIIKEATEFASQQRAIQALNIDDFVSFDAGDSTKIKDVLNDINVAFREEKIEILKTAEAGDISEIEKTQAINKLAAAKIEVDERAQALVARNTIRSVEDLGDLSSLLNFDTETTVKDLDNDLRGIKRAAEDSITDIEKFLIDNPQLDAEYEAFLRGVIGNIPAIQARVSNDLRESAEYSKLKDALSGQSLFSDISGENIGLNSGGLADTLLTAGNIYRDAITDTFSLINDQASFAFAFPSLDIDFTSVNSIREGVSQVAAAFQEEKDKIREVVENDTDFNSTQESINKEVERRTRALERYRDNLIEIKLPIIFTLTKSADFLDDVNGLLGSVNTIQQNEIANLESGIKSRADDIKSTQDRLREAIEAGDINEVKSYQQKLNGLTSLQKKEDALAKKKFEANKKTQRAMAIVNAFAGAARALTLPFPQNLLAFASTLATGKAAVDAIDRTEYQSASGLDVGGGSLSGGDLSNNTDLNSLSGTLTAEQLIERGLDDDRGDTRRRQVITVDLPDDRIITTRMAIELYNEILEQAGDGQIAAIQAL